MEPKKKAPESRCAGCGVLFACGMQARQEPCWCVALPPLEPVPGRGCLCKTCLEQELAAKLRG